MSQALRLFPAACMTTYSSQRPNAPRSTKPPKSEPTRLQNTTGFGARRRGVPTWGCVEGCGACCKLAKDPSSFATPEEIFSDPKDVELYRSMIGPDGWCIYYEKTTRKCSIYADRPYFCRVNPEVFKTLYGIREKKFDKEACNSCRDTIKAIYGSNSRELASFNQFVTNSAPVSP